MSQTHRCPNSCEYRRTDQLRGQSIPTCQLASRYLGATLTGVVQVDQSICEACCEQPLLSGPRLNPVVASLVFQAANTALVDLSKLTTFNQVELQRVKQFAKSCLPIDSTTSGAIADSDEFRLMTDDTSKEVSEQRSAEDKVRIGLVGRNSGFGLNYQNRDIARHLGIDRWLTSATVDPILNDIPCRVDQIPRPLSRIEMAAWMDGLDVVMFVESPLFPNLTTVARQLNIPVVCVPNWEWVHPGLEWLSDVDLMLCPTRHTEQLFRDWKSQYRFHWEVDCQPWPVDINRFRFRQRWFCRRFVYIHGSGGVRAVDRNGKATELQRKGFDVLVSAARLAPDIPIIAYVSNQDFSINLPSNLEIRPQPFENSHLYSQGDVCIQPSHWEGLGLPLLECQAAGMPLVTTNAPPMSEHRPWKSIPVHKFDAVHLGQDLCIPAARIEPEQLAHLMKSLHGRFIGFASRNARRFIVREHNWTTAGPQIQSRLQRLVAESVQKSTVYRAD
jgi:glycosyltransferase involved in cell wall biosynthesis